VASAVQFVPSSVVQISAPSVVFCVPKYNLPFLVISSERNKSFFDSIKNSKLANGTIDAMDRYGNKVLMDVKASSNENFIALFLRDSSPLSKTDGEISGLEFLSQASIKLSEMMPEQDIYQYVANQLVILVPESMVFVNTQPSKTEMNTVASATSSSSFARGIRTIGGDPVGRKFKISEKAQFTIHRGKISVLGGGVYELSFGQIPKPICKIAEKVAGIKKIFSIGFYWKGEVFGSAAILTKQDSTELKNAGIIETFINLASVALQRRKAEDQLERTIKDLYLEKSRVLEEKDKIETILESIGDGVFVVDSNFKVIHYNKAAGEISGFTTKDVFGKNYNQVLKFVDEDSKKPTVDFISECLKTGGIKRVNKKIDLVLSNGAFLPVDNTVAALTDEKGKISGVVIIFRDVSKERQIDQAKTEFVSLASHQLRTPLSAINWFTELLLKGSAGKINAKQKDFLNEVYSSSKRMVDLINSLLNVSRLELGTFVVEPEPTDLQLMVKSVINEMQPSIIKKKMKVEENCNKLEKISVDPKLTRIIFQNLISNAIKYTNDGGRVSIVIKDEIDQKLKNKYPGGVILISVADNGLGIPKKDQPKIFSKLFRADNIKVKDVDGTGLGLYIIKSIVGHFGGEIWFESEEDRGTTFWLRLPKSGMAKKEGTKSLSYREENG
jgi:PAS domain S-box-containing protein